MGFRHSKESKKSSLDDIFSAPDPHGLLTNVAAKARNSTGAIEVTRFEEINSFIDANGRHPDPSGELSEKQLSRRLKKFIESPEMHLVLREYDRHGLIPDSELLVAEAKPVYEVSECSDQNQVEVPTAAAKSEIESASSLDDIWSSDAFARLDGGDDSILEMTHVKPYEERQSPDEVAQRKQCADFYKFESTFRDTHEKLRNGKAKTSRFQQASQMREGDMFILQGVVCLVDEVGEFREDNFGNYDPRLRVIFENGTESNLLLRSLGKALYQDETGRRIIREADSVEDAFNNVTHKDKRSGQIYIVTTLSQSPDLKAIPNLVKIGYTELTVEERTRNSERDTAFLEAPIKILAAIECYNLNPHRFESLIHGFLHAQRLVITLTGKDGKNYHPKEWFSVPLDTAREVVRRIIDGSIVKYRMDNTTGRIVPKKPL